MADEYILKDKVLNLIEHNYRVYHYVDERYENVVYATAQTICMVVADIPAADVQPVKHGTWRKDEQGYDVYVECSECGLNLSISNYIENEWRETLKYCPCCGARMEDGQDD